MQFLADVACAKTRKQKSIVTDALALLKASSSTALVATLPGFEVTEPDVRADKEHDPSASQYSALLLGDLGSDYAVTATYRSAKSR